MSIGPLAKLCQSRSQRRSQRANACLQGLLGLRSNNISKRLLGSYKNFKLLIPAGNPLLDLEILPQHDAHDGIDPLRHTYNALLLLDTGDIEHLNKTKIPGFKKSLIELIRIAMLYHDIGKLEGPFDTNHPEKSAKIARDILKDPSISGVGELNDKELDFALLLIKSHDLLGDLSKDYYSGKTNNAEGLFKIRTVFEKYMPKSLTLEQLFLIHTVIAKADIGSIPGLKKVRNGLNRVTELFLQLINNSHLISLNKISMTNYASEAQTPLTDEMRRLNRFTPSLVTLIQQQNNTREIRLIFSQDSLEYQTEFGGIEYYDGRFIARSFRRAGIKNIKLKSFLSNAEINALKDILRSAENGEIAPLMVKRLGGLSVIDRIEEIAAKEEKEQSIPGFYKHYTNLENFTRITQNNQIDAQPHSKNGEVREGIYLTGLSLSPKEAADIIFIANPEYQDRSTHVIAFDILDPELDARIEKTGIEFFIEKELNLNDRRIRVRYSGENPMQFAA
ncbi:MAG: HD domain-containing protein [Candidatus Margulisiibacteriota bacterium]|nr:HD domain-containing protein [Candidatus Margulisiibacteriota bacterium]